MPFPPFAHEADALQLLRVAMQGAALGARDELRAWLAGPVRSLLECQALLLVVGDFCSGDLRCEVAGYPVREGGGQWPQQTLAPLACYLHDCWTAAQHAPCRIDVATFAVSVQPAPAGEAQALHQGIRSALVHGTRDALRRDECLVAALGTHAVPPDDRHVQAMRLLAPVIDAALRRTPVHPSCHRARAAGLPSSAGPLSERERQIMQWVAMGKTNPEIGCILRISEFTVKNHLKSIFAKLDVTNRAQAVAKLTHQTVHA